MNNLWYQSLTKSALTPPPIVFSIVWGIIYTLIFASLAIYLTGGVRRRDIVTLGLFGFNLLLNFSWSCVFFGLHNKLAALVIILLLIITLVPVIILFSNKSKVAAAFLSVYLLWLLFAFYLNYYIVVAN